MEIEAFVGETNIDPLINEFTERSPVAKVAGAAIDFVNDDTGGFSGAEQFEHPVKDRAAMFGSGLAFFKPVGNAQIEVRRIPRNGVALFLKRHAFFTLFGRGDTDVAEELLHGSGASIRGRTMLTYRPNASKG